METRRSGKDAVRQTRRSSSSSPSLGVKPSSVKKSLLSVKKSPRPASGLQKMKKLTAHKLKDTINQEITDETFKAPTVPEDKHKGLTPSPDQKTGSNKMDEGGSSKSPGIRTRLSTGSIHMNGTMTISTAKERAQQEVMMKQFEKEMPMSPANSLKKRLSSSAPGDGPLSDHPPPKKRKIGKNDGSGEDNRNDYYCWLCHKEGTVVCCELCPRVYHIKCLELAGELPADWVCPECEKIMVAECHDTRSKSMSMLTLDQLCTLLTYALERMEHEGSDPFQKPVDMSVFPNYSDYVFNPMDIETLGKNIRKRLYGSTEAFTADTKWILHNCIIYNGAQHKLTSSAKMIVKICKHEMNEIELCPDCYLNSCIRENDEWFSELCRTPHTLVWAKLKGYPFWPAKALREADGVVDVRFFGAHDRSWVPVSQCFHLSKNIPTSLQKGKRNAGLDGAIEELNQHVRKLKEKFGHFEYAPFRTPYDKTDSYKPTSTKPPANQSSSVKPFSPVTMKNQQSEAFKRSKLSCKTAAAVRSKYTAMVSLKKAETSPLKLSIRLNSPENITGELKVGTHANESDEIDGVETAESSINDETAVKDELKSGLTNVKKSFVSMSIVKKVEEKILGLNESKTDGHDVNKTADPQVVKPEEISHDLDQSGNETVSANSDNDSKSSKIDSNTVASDDVGSCTKAAPVDDKLTEDDGKSSSNVSADKISADAILTDVTRHDIPAEKINDTPCKSQSPQHSSAGKENIDKEVHADTPVNVEKHDDGIMDQSKQPSSDEVATPVLPANKENEISFREKLKLTIANCKEKLGETEIETQPSEEDNVYNVDGEDVEDQEGLSLVMSDSDDDDEYEPDESEAPSSLMLTDSEEDSMKDDLDVDPSPVKRSKNSWEMKGSVGDVNISSDKEKHSEMDKEHSHETSEVTEGKGLLVHESVKPSNNKEEGILDKKNLHQEKTFQKPSDNSVSNMPLNPSPNLAKEPLETVKGLQAVNEVVENDQKNEKNVEQLDRNSVEETGSSLSTAVEMESPSKEKTEPEIKAVERLKEIVESEALLKEKAGPSERLLSDGNESASETHNKVGNTSTNQNAMDISISGDDSDIESLVIDLDAGKDSPARLGIKDGEVKNSSGFKDDTSAPIGLSSSKETPKLQAEQDVVKNTPNITESILLIGEKKSLNVKGTTSESAKSTIVTKIISSDNVAENVKTNSPDADKRMTCTTTPSTASHQSKDDGFVSNVTGTKTDSSSQDQFKKIILVTKAVSTTAAPGSHYQSIKSILVPTVTSNTAISNSQQDQSKRSGFVTKVTSDTTASGSRDQFKKSILVTKVTSKTANSAAQQDQSKGNGPLYSSTGTTTASGSGDQSKESRLVPKVTSNTATSTALQDQYTGNEFVTKVMSTTTASGSQDQSKESRLVSMVTGNTTTSAVRQALSKGTGLVTKSNVNGGKKKQKTGSQGTAMEVSPEEAIDLVSDASPESLPRKSSLSQGSKDREPDLVGISSNTCQLTSVDGIAQTPMDTGASFSYKSPEEISEKFLKKIMNSVQKNFGDMVNEFKSSQMPSDDELLKETEQVKWNCKNEIIELKQNFQLTVSEMQASWLAQREQMLKSMTMKHVQDLDKQKKRLINEHEETLNEAKKKQWCANCQKEAIFYCCWNTSYCDYPCQQAHWPQHSLTCNQTKKNADGTDQGVRLSVPNQNTSKASLACSSNSNSSQTVTVSSSSKAAMSYRLLPETLASAIKREEEKRGEARTAPIQQKQFIPGATVLRQNIHPGHVRLASQSNNMMAPMQGGIFLNQGMPARPPTNQMILQQPMMQPTLYPVQVQRQAPPPYSNTILFPSTNPAQQGVLGYNPGRRY